MYRVLTNQIFHIFTGWLNLLCLNWLCIYLKGAKPCMNFAIKMHLTVALDFNAQFKKADTRVEIGSNPNEKNQLPVNFWMGEKPIINPELKLHSAWRRRVFTLCISSRLHSFAAPTIIIIILIQSSGVIELLPSECSQHDIGATWLVPIEKCDICVFHAFVLIHFVRLNVEEVPNNRDMYM